jgi:CRISPR-associated protein Csx17
VAAALRALQAAMFDACRTGGALTDVLSAVGALERALGRSVKARDKVRPLHRLSANWHTDADDRSDEFAIASAVASWGIRSAIEPVDEHRRWDSSVRPIWSDRDPLENIVALAMDRLRTNEDAGRVPLRGRSFISTGTLSRLLQGSIDLRKLSDLVFGLALVDPDNATPGRPWHEEAPVIPSDAVFGILRAVTSPDFLAEERMRQGVSTRVHPAPKVIAVILAQLAARETKRAIEIAERRLIASRHALRAPVDRDVGTRDNFPALAAALVVPLPWNVERAWINPVVTKPTDTEFSVEESP